MARGNKIKVLLAKPGLDGHDRGVKVVAMALRDAGMEVIYTGLHCTIDEIVATARQEGIDVIGLSILSGAHLTITEKLMSKLKKESLEDIAVLVGGVIPKEDIQTLNSYGVKGIFPVGSTLDKIVDTVKTGIPNTK